LEISGTIGLRKQATFRERPSVASDARREINSFRQLQRSAMFIEISARESSKLQRSDTLTPSKKHLSHCGSNLTLLAKNLIPFSTAALKRTCRRAAA
jgi:hypothetical protein